MALLRRRRGEKKFKTISVRKKKKKRGKREEGNEETKTFPHTHRLQKHTHKIIITTTKYGPQTTKT